MYEWKLIDLEGLGEVLVLMHEGVLVRIELNPHLNNTQEKYDEIQKYSPYKQEMKSVVHQLKKYAVGKLTQFDVAFKIEGQTEFTKTVLKAVSKIAYSKTLSYGEIALKVNKPKAFRAVGGAVGRNPIPIVIPCHRVLASNQRLGGFSGGLENKRTLLDLENVIYL